jgi:hypothetical protein
LGFNSHGPLSLSSGKYAQSLTLNHEKKNGSSLSLISDCLIDSHDQP